MSDPQSTDAQQQEQMRQYVEQLRAADPAEIVAQAFTMIATGAEVKLGRNDARLLIDALGGLLSAVGDTVPNQLAQGMRNAVTQLQQAQVTAERQAEQQQAQDTEGQPSEAPAAPDAQAQPQGGQDDSSRMRDRLWIPGRDH